MASLPEDIIIMEILTKLPVKWISRFRCVCKLWSDLFKNPKFIKMHHQHAIQNNKFSVLLNVYHDHPDLDLVFHHYTMDFDVTSSSYQIPIETNLPPDTFDLSNIVSTDCLIGLHNSGNKMSSKICLWNPSTREHKYIPTLNRGNEPCISVCFWRYGVCYDWKIDDYKLFELVATERDGDKCSDVWVCRLGSNSWNRIGNIPYTACYRTKVSTKSLNGIIHWMGKTNVIHSFDIVEVRRREIQIPSCYWNCFSYQFGFMEVGVLGEDLYLSVYVTQKNIDLWVMKDYGVQDSWTKIFSLPKKTINFDKLVPLHYLSENHEILLQGFRFESNEDFLVSYDPKSGRLVTPDIPCLPKHFYATTFVGSLVSLNSGEFGNSSKKYLDIRACAYKVFSSIVERAKSGLSRYDWGS